MKKLFIFFAGCTVFISACTTNAVTGRKQLSLISEGALQQEAVTQYQSFLSQNKVVSDNVSKDAEMVRRVGGRIASAITKYYTSKGLSKELDGYKWEFNLVDNKEINAWCMPGGKVVVYTGLLPIAQNEAALAIVMGHEITHAVAHHGQERISQAMLAQGLALGGDLFTSGNPQANGIFNNIYGPAAQIGVLLPNSRNQELEADHYGLIFAAMAGYNPREAIPFWTRMANASNGSNKPPAFLSSHPTDEARIQKLQTYMNEALKYYKPVNSR
ncbi:MAG: M48 family metallopeptidase [Ginsengibacter sp.]